MSQFPLYTKSGYGDFYKTVSHTCTITVKKHENGSTKLYVIQVYTSAKGDMYENHRTFSEPSSRTEFEQIYEESHWHINKANTP